MASEATIKARIESSLLGLPYSSWTIGVTDDPAKRKQDHSNPVGWRLWDADTERAARNVEAYFIAKGMKGGTGGAGRADYVYIF